MKLSIYHHKQSVSEAADDFIEKLLDRELQFRASQFLDVGLEDMEHIHRAVSRAIEVCRHTDVPVRQHFRLFYTTSGPQDASCDWWLSPLARKLVILNAGTDNPVVARVQMKLLNTSSSKA